MRSQTFKANTIISAFRKTGFVPHNPEMVVDKIKSLQPRATTPPPEPIVLANTPHSGKDVIIYGQWLQRLLQTQAFVIPQGMQRPLARFVKGSLANAYSRQISERDLEAIHKEAVVKRARKSLAGTVAQKGGWMSVDQIRKSLCNVEETAIDKAKKALERANRSEEIRKEKATQAKEPYSTTGS